ncbi:MAG: molybdopterin-dependent oxidoreductase [Gammaproteobacteria bacterium]|nr:molybdopterin-dependent oxidoreductase [Gammaproteobacteria bacterium]
MDSWHNSVCPHDCPSACALEVEKLAAGRIGRVRGSKHNPYTDGVICAKVSRYAERAHHPARLTRPLRRTSSKSGNGAAFEPIGWEQALDLVSEKFTAASGRFGAESVWPYYYGGTMGLVQRDGIMRLVSAMGYSGLHKTICVQIAYDGWGAGAGALLGADGREMAHSDLIVLWGCNAAATQINAMTHISKARKRGAKLVVIDPYRNATAKVADLHLAPRPGSDGALACAVMHLLFKNGHADRDYLAEYSDDAGRLERHLQSRGPEWAAAITGIEAARIAEFAEVYGATRKSYIRLGIGFSRSRNGAVNVHAVSCLPVVTGAWQYRGGGALLATSDSFRLDERLIQGPAPAANGARMLDMSLIGPILCNDRTALKGGPPVKAMLIQNTNPMLVAPELAAVKRGFERDDLFVCVHEQFMTETAQMADVILPATMFVEHDDLYRSYGHTFLQVGEKVVDAPGECRSNHEVIAALAARLAGARREDFAGFQLSALQLVDETLERSGYPPRRAFTRGHFTDCAPPFESAHFLDGFHWPDKKFRFAPDWAAIGPYARGMPALPDHWDVIDNPSPEHPLRLVAAPARGYLNSTFTQSPSSVRHQKCPQLQINPAAAKRFGIEDRRPVVVGNRRGSVTVTARYAEKTQADTVVVEGIWPASAFPEGVGINLLIDSTPVAPNGGAAFHDTAVWVKAAE